MAAANAVERGAQVRFPPPLAFLAGILLGVATAYLVAPAPVPLPRAIAGIGAVLLLALGIVLIVSARTHFVRTGQSPIPWKPSPELIVNGPYRFTRNPMYVGITLIEIGLGLALDNLWIALFALPALAAVHVLAVRPEERYLRGKFGESYAAYLARVRRYL